MSMWNDGSTGEKCDLSNKRRRGDLGPGKHYGAQSSKAVNGSLERDNSH